MTVTPYNSIEPVQECHIPAFDIYWPSDAGCSPRHVYDVARNQTCPTSTVKYYDPLNVQEIRDRRHLRGRRVGNPPFAVTPYYRSTTTTKRHLLRRLNCGGAGQDAYRQYGHVYRIGVSCVPTVLQTEHLGPFGTIWYEVSDDISATEYVTNGFDWNEVYNAKCAVMDSVSVSALTSYDILTEIAEAREIPGLIKSISDDLTKILRALRGRFSLRDLRSAARLAPLDLLRHPERALRRLGDQWMRYRYGIMPLVYSYRDVMKTINRGFETRDRQNKTVQASSLGVTLPGPTVVYKRTTISGGITLRGSVFQHFDYEEAARFAGIGVNPLVTAWELMPYSFVADWFVNVGDFITIKSTSPLSRVNYACISQRANYTTETWVHYKKEDKTLTFTLCPCSPWLGTYPPVADPVVISRPEEEQLLKETTVDSYVREVFALGAAQLRLNPTLNWRRLFDSAAMSLNILGTLNKFLKG